MADSEINTREIAEQIIFDHARDVERLSIREALAGEDGYRDLPDDVRHALVDEIDSLVQLATITVEFPAASDG